MVHTLFIISVFFFNDTATTEIYTLSLHDALPISECGLERTPLVADQHHRRPGQERDDDRCDRQVVNPAAQRCRSLPSTWSVDRKSTRLNSSHANISYAVFCLKKKKNNILKTLHLNGTHALYY